MENANQVTIRHLMNMTTGWPSYSQDKTLSEQYLSGNLKLNTLSHLEALQRYQYGKKALFEPGTDYYYGSTNYMILTMIIDKVNGAPQHVMAKL